MPPPKRCCMAFQHLLEVLKPLVFGSFEVSCVCMATRPTIDLNSSQMSAKAKLQEIDLLKILFGFSIPKDQQKQKQQKTVPNQGAEFTIFGRTWLVTTLTCLRQCIITGLTTQVILQKNTCTKRWRFETINI